MRAARALTPLVAPLARLLRGPATYDVGTLHAKPPCAFNTDSIAAQSASLQASARIQHLLANGRVRAAMHHVETMLTSKDTQHEHVQHVLFSTVQTLGKMIRSPQHPTPESLRDTPLHPALALASMYDTCSDTHTLWPSAASASMVASMARCLPADALIPVLDAICNDLLARPRANNTSLLCAMIAAYGRARCPGRGELFLQRYVGTGPTCEALAPKNAPFFSRSRALFARCDTRSPIDIPLHDTWSASTAIWNALIRARTTAGDMAAAALWLERYRFVAHLPDTLCDLHALTRPVQSASPYLTLMHAFSSGAGIRDFFLQSGAEAQTALRRTALAMDAPFKTAAIHGLLKAVRDDGIIPGVAMLNFLASFEAGRQRLESAARLVTEAFAIPGKGAVRYRVHRTTYMPLFALHAAVAAQQSAPLLAPIMTSPLPPSALAQELQSARQVLCACIAYVRRADSSSAAKWWRKECGTALLNQAMDALLAAHDYPAALHALALYDEWGVQPDAWMHALLWRHLGAHTNPQHALEQRVVAQANYLQNVSTPVPAWAEALRACKAQDTVLAAAAIHVQD
ncbi:lipoyl(octanoyl) transferase [Malassezia vespertilionis]|uniref:Uncharacterized protein n=1 Tax=Malassezia vespertilionis TaxID=2020962 RepID=A0A2N1JAC1_9BASI|nr:lipoyl(octanoyl) transferase [Malassezia vespertilionis]PKI83487.1 hypothetical protein MVES_002419 [Malassezia vespertilionis]WFD07202.1 lipoyl(octanoyl) transferase [Malassezia vespertilionis]